MFHFERLEDLVATSSLVVAAVVVSVEASGTAGRARGQIGMQEVTLSVERVFRGDPGGSTTSFSEAATGASGGPLHVNGKAPTEKGANGVFFLWGDAAQPAGLGLINTQGRLLRTGAGGVEPSRSDDPLSGRLGSLSYQALLDAVQASADRVESEGTVPQEPS